MSSSPALPPSIDLNSSLGSLLIGTYVSTALFGFTTLQTYSYYNNYPKDRVFLKGLVAIVWHVLALEFVHTVFITRAYYLIGVTNFGSVDDFITLPFEIKFSIVWTNLVASVVQTFFANRIRIMSGRWEIPLFCTAISLVRLVVSLVAAAVDVSIPSQADFNSKWKWIVILVLVLDVVNDLTIAGSLSYFLSRSRTGFASTDRVINRLIKFSMQTGLVTSTTGTAMLICFLAMPNNFIWIALFIVLAKLYANSFLATLNARSELRSHLSSGGLDGNVLFQSEQRSSEQTGSAAFQSRLSHMLRPKQQDRPIAIEMTTEVAKHAESLTDGTEDELATPSRNKVRLEA